MSDKRNITNGGWARIGDWAFGLGFKRYEDPDKKPLWRLYLTRQPNDPVLEVDLRRDDLIQIRHFCDRALSALETDGGRKVEESP